MCLSPAIYDQYLYSGSGSWRWRTTGSYAAAIDLVKVTFPEGVDLTQLAVSIHTIGELDLDTEWFRDVAFH